MLIAQCVEKTFLSFARLRWQAVPYHCKHRVSRMKMALACGSGWGLALTLGFGITKPPIISVSSRVREPQALATTMLRVRAPTVRNWVMAMLCSRNRISQFRKNLQVAAELVSIAC